MLRARWILYDPLARRRTPPVDRTEFECVPREIDDAWGREPSSAPGGRSARPISSSFRLSSRRQARICWKKTAADSVNPRTPRCHRIECSWAELLFRILKPHSVRTDRLSSRDFLREPTRCFSSPPACIRLPLNSWSPTSDVTGIELAPPEVIRIQGSRLDRKRGAGSIESHGPSRSDRPADPRNDGNGGKRHG